MKALDLFFCLLVRYCKLLIMWLSTRNMAIWEDPRFSTFVEMSMLKSLQTC